MKTDEHNEIVKISVNGRIYIFRAKMCVNKKIRDEIREDIIQQAKEGFVLLNEYIELVEEIRPSQMDTDSLDKIAEAVAKRMVETMNQLDNH